MNLILFEESEISSDGLVVLADHRAGHIRSVLQSKPGERIRVGRIDGPRGMGTVESMNSDSVFLRCDLEKTTPERPFVDLLLALPRPKVMKRLWAQLAAIGVGRIILTNAWKVERNYFDTHVLEPNFVRGLLIEGLQQAGDTRIPEVSLHKRFKVLIEDELDGLFPEGRRLVAHPGPDAGVPDSGEGRVLVAVGPEGGWTEYETNLLAEHGFRSISLGHRTLRTDTACIALLACVHNMLRRA